MKRDLDALADGRFDLVVAGGGVVGAAIARDAARRGLRVALIEAGDFASAASEGMSHFVHGGIRYLTTRQIGQVRNSLRERATWMRTAPHQIVPQACMTPIVGMKPYEAVGFRGIVALFNLLGGRNVLPPGAGLPTKLSPAEAIRMEPAIEQPGLTGALVYHDCRVDEPERVVLGLLQDASLHGAVTANHVSCVGMSLAGGRVSGVDASDEIGGGTVRIKTKALINATGPWAEQLATRLLQGQRQAQLTMSKGVHIVVEPLARTHSLNLLGRREHATVLPWRGMSLIGTTDDIFDGSPHDGHDSAADIDKLQDKITRLLPSARGRLSPVRDSYSALRALPGKIGDSYFASREDTIADHAVEGAVGFFSVFGGKWTTARLMAEKAVGRLPAELVGKARPCDTAVSPLPDAPASANAFREEWRRKLATWQQADVDAWVAAYGTALSNVLAHLADPATPDAKDREQARFAYAAADEMAVTPRDVVHRLGRWYRIQNPGAETRAGEWLAARAKLADSGERAQGQGAG